MRTWIPRVGLVLALLSASAPAFADVPDIVLQSAADKRVIVKRTDGGTYVGHIAGYDATNVQVRLDDGSITIVRRADIEAVRLDLPPAPATPAPPLPEAPPAAVALPPPPPPPELSPHREDLRDAHKRYDTATTIAGWSMFAGGVGLALADALTDIDADLAYPSGLVAGSGLGMMNTSAPGLRMLGNPNATDEEVAAVYRRSGIMSLALWTPLSAGVGTLQLFLRGAPGGGFDTYVWAGGLLHGAALGYAGSGVYDLVMASRLEKGLPTAGLTPPAVSLLAVPCASGPGACGTGARLAWAF